MYLGVDAGNTKSVAIVCDSDGTVLGTGRAGCGDIYGVSDPSLAVQAVVGCVQAALASAGARPAGIRSAAFRLAGVDWPEDREFWELTLRQALPDIGHRSVLNDGFAPIRCAELSGAGVAMTAGTGSAIAGRGPTGDEWSLSWWGQDRLGATGIGHDALAAVFRYELGLAEPTALTPVLLEIYRARTVSDLLHSFTRRHGRRPRTDKGLAARAVIEAAADDPVALRIVNDHAALIAGYVRVTAIRVGFDLGRDPVPVVLAGPVLTAAPPVFRSAVTREVSLLLPAARIVATSLPPVSGAALDAIAESGATVTEETVARMAGSLTDPATWPTAAHSFPDTEGT